MADKLTIVYFCGTGAISLFLAKQAGKVTGIGVVPEAVRDAQKNAVKNGINNVEFVPGKAEEVMPQMVKNSRPRVVVVKRNY